MWRRLAFAVLIALSLTVPVLIAQDAVPAKAKKPAISTEPWPDDDVMRARREEAHGRKLFQDGPALTVDLTADFSALNKERTPNNNKQFPGVLTVNGAPIPVQLGSRGHLRLKSTTCDFVPIKIDFPAKPADGIFEGQTSLKLGTHCRNIGDFDQYVIREHLAYKLVNLVTPLSFRTRLARVTYIDQASQKKISTHSALFLESESDVARRHDGRQARQERMLFNDFDKAALTTMMMVEYMLGNTDYSISALHNVVIVQDKRRRFLPIPYDFDSSGLVNPPYAAPDERLHLRSVTDRLYRGPCRTLDEFVAAAEPFHAHQADMMAAIEASELNATHKRDVKGYLESFFDRIATPQWIKRTFVDGCPASRQRV